MTACVLTCIDRYLCPRFLFIDIGIQDSRATGKEKGRIYKREYFIRCHPLTTTTSHEWFLLLISDVCLTGPLSLSSGMSFVVFIVAFFCPSRDLRFYVPTTTMSCVIVLLRCSRVLRRYLWRSRGGLVISRIPDEIMHLVTADHEVETTTRRHASQVDEEGDT